MHQDVPGAGKKSKKASLLLDSLTRLAVVRNREVGDPGLRQSNLHLQGKIQARQVERRPVLLRLEVEEPDEVPVVLISLVTHGRKRFRQ